MKELNKLLSSFDFRCGLSLAADMSGRPMAVIFNSAPKSHRHSMADMAFNQCLARLIDDGTKAGVWCADDPAWSAHIMYYSFHGGCTDA